MLRETIARLLLLAERPEADGDPLRAWEAARPHGFDDARKFLAGLLLIPPAGGGGAAERSGGAAGLAARPRASTKN